MKFKNINKKLYMDMLKKEDNLNFKSYGIA